MNTLNIVLRQRLASLAIAIALVSLVTLSFPSSAEAAVVPKVPLASTENYSVLAGSTVTNTGGTILDLSLGLHPGTSAPGFPPGIVNAPGIIDIATATALQAKNDLTAAYIDAQGRPIDGTTPADLGGEILIPGVYAAAAKGPLLLTGVLTLDGQGDPASVFIIQTDSTLDTAVGSSVLLINGATECNVFWAVGSSATLGTGSTFAGNILAQTAISISDSVTIGGRAFARTAAVTLINDTFTTPTCNVVTPAATTTTTAATTATGGGSGSGSGTGSSNGIGRLSGAPTTGATPLQSTPFPWMIFSVGGLFIGSVLLVRRTGLLKSKT